MSARATSIYTTPYSAILPLIEHACSRGGLGGVTEKFIQVCDEGQRARTVVPVSTSMRVRVICACSRRTCFHERTLPRFTRFLLRWEPPLPRRLRDIFSLALCNHTQQSNMKLLPYTRQLLCWHAYHHRSSIPMTIRWLVPRHPTKLRITAFSTQPLTFLPLFPAQRTIAEYAPEKKSARAVLRFNQIETDFKQKIILRMTCCMRSSCRHSKASDSNWKALCVMRVRPWCVAT